MVVPFEAASVPLDADSVQPFPKRSPVLCRGRQSPTEASPSCYRPGHGSSEPLRIDACCPRHSRRRLLPLHRVEQKNRSLISWATASLRDQIQFSYIPSLSRIDNRVYRLNNLVCI